VYLVAVAVYPVPSSQVFEHSDRAAWRRRLHRRHAIARAEDPRLGPYSQPWGNKAATSPGDRSTRISESDASRTKTRQSLRWEMSACNANLEIPCPLNCLAGVFTSEPKFREATFATRAVAGRSPCRARGVARRGQIHWRLILLSLESAVEEEHIVCHAAQVRPRSTRRTTTEALGLGACQPLSNIQPRLTDRRSRAKASQNHAC
jgi:hypothetical protein